MQGLPALQGCLPGPPRLGGLLLQLLALPWVPRGEHTLLPLPQSLPLLLLLAPPALHAKHVECLAKGQLAAGRPVLPEPAAKPGARLLGAVHSEVETLELLGAHDAWGGAA